MKKESVTRRLLTSIACLAIGSATAAGCAGPGNAVDTQLRIDAGSLSVHLPAFHSATAVVVLHSLGHQASEAVDEGWTKASDKYGFVAVYPDNGGASWNAGLCCGTAMSSGRDDVSWLAKAIQDVKVRYNLTTVYLSGFSNGGMMVERLVAEHPDLTRRIAVWGAAPEMPQPGQWPGSGLLYRGQYDATVPYQGGQVSIGGILYSIRPTLSTPHFLVGASVRGMQAANYGHAPAPNWPDMAWAFLSGKAAVPPTPKR